MKDYYNLFVWLSLQQCTKEDYANKLKVKKHNAAFKKLKKLQEEMKQNCNEEILCRLLSHEDDRVKVNAASLCLQMNVLADQATHVLRRISDNSIDATISFEAEMTLKVLGITE